MSNEPATARSEALEMLVVCWSLLWRSVVFFPLAALITIVRLAVIIAVLYPFLWLCTWLIAHAIMREWFYAALCLVGVLAWAAGARFVRRRWLRSAFRLRADHWRWGCFL